MISAWIGLVSPWKIKLVVPERWEEQSGFPKICSWLRKVDVRMQARRFYEELVYFYYDE